MILPALLALSSSSLGSSFMRPSVCGVHGAAVPSQSCDTAPTAGASDILALDLGGELLDQLGHALQARVDRKRAAVDFERLSVVADVVQHQPEAGERAEVARLALQDLADVGERAAEILLQVMDGGAPVPGFHVVRLDGDNGVEQLKR